MSRCRRTSPATAIGSTASSTIARWSRLDGGAGRAARVPPSQGTVMLRQIGKRLATAIPSIIGVVIVTFLLTRVLPGDTAAYFAGPAATPQSIEEIRKSLGLDRPLPEQFVRYLKDL